MNKPANHKPVFKEILKDFRYDLLKAIIFILIFTASILYSNAESNKYYYNRSESPKLIINK